MAEQLALSFVDSAPRWYDAETWTYYAGVPDLSAPGSEYTVLIRAPWDPPRRSRKERHAALGGPAAAVEWRKWRDATAEEWSARIVELLEDGEPRTFNAIAVELVDATADVVGPTAVGGLWLAVERGHIWWTREAPIHFIHDRFVTRCGCAECAATEAA